MGCSVTIFIVFYNVFVKSLNLSDQLPWAVQIVDFKLKIKKDEWLSSGNNLEDDSGGSSLPTDRRAKFQLPCIALDEPLGKVPIFCFIGEYLRY